MIILNRFKSSRFSLKDYSECDQGLGRINDDNIFIYNQSQNPSSGSRGIACIALAVVYNNNEFKTNGERKVCQKFDNLFFQNMVSSELLIDNGKFV